MEWIQSILDSGTTPFITAFLLGILTAISPCPMATNITAIGYISKSIESQHRVFWNGILYTIGRIITYAGIGFIIIPILQKGSSIYFIQKAISHYSDAIIAPALILIGLFMLLGKKLNLRQFGFSIESKRVKQGGTLGALLLGILFSFAFCPSSGVLYFGMLIPLAANETNGYLLPFIYAIASGMPVIVVAWFLAYSIANIGKFYQSIQNIQKWMNTIIALLFIAVGIYYALILWL